MLALAPRPARREARSRSTRSSRSPRGSPSCSATDVVLADELRRRRRAQGRRPICATARSRCSRTCASTPARRRTTTASRGARGARRRLRQRRVRHRAPRARVDGGHGAARCRKGAGFLMLSGDPTLLGKLLGRRRAAVRRGARRRQGLRQDRGAREPARARRRDPDRRRDGEHVPRGAAAARSASRCVEEDKLALARAPSRKPAAEQGCEVLLPVDAVARRRLDADAQRRRSCRRDEVPDG